MACATILTYVPPYIYIYIRTAPARICTPLIVSRSLANYRPSPLAQKPRNDVLACGDPITPSNTVKYHPSSNTLISREQREGVRNWRASEASETLSGVTQSRFRYIYLFIYLFIYMVRRTSFSARASNRKEGGVTCQSFLNQ